MKEVIKYSVNEGMNSIPQLDYEIDSDSDGLYLAIERHNFQRGIFIPVFSTYF